jgi:hypothetical protein
MDYYFVAGHTYGAWNDPLNAGAYEGRQQVAWEWDGTTETEIAFWVPPRATVYTGWMLTDEQARFVGLAP